MQNATKKITDKIILDKDKFSILNHSFQNSETNKKLKLKYSFLDNYNLFNLKNNIILKINQIQNNQQITNNKLSCLISILFSKLIGSKNYKLFHNHFSILPNKKEPNIKKEKQANAFQDRTKTEINHTERINITNKNIIKKKKVENISLASELEIKRYNLSNQKTKSKENIFVLNNSQIDKNKNNKNIKNENEELYNNSNNNLFRINNNNNNHYNSLNKNSSSDNMNNSKKIFYISNNRKPVTFNEISNNLNVQNNYYCINKDNKNKKNNNNNNNNNNNIDYKKSYSNASNSIQNQMSNNNSINNSINKDKDYNKSNNSENKLNKGPVKIKLNPIEKPILLMNFNENIDKASERSKKNKNKNLNNNNNNMLNNIIDISNNTTPLNERRINYNNIHENKRMSYNGETKNTIDNSNDISDEHMHSFRGKRKFSEAKSEADKNYSHLSESKNKQGFSQKIRGFNFRNNIKFTQKPNSGKMSQISQITNDEIKGGSVRYSNNNGFFGQINSLENEYKQ